MSQAVVRTEQEAFRRQYAGIAPAVAKSLPNHITPERFERTAMIAVQRNPDLLNQSKCDRRSLLLALQRAAGDGLLPDGREGAVVLFGNQAQWMPMVAGLMKLARNSGEIASLNAHVAYEGERFHVVLGDEEKIEHERNLELADAAKVMAVYAVATLTSGEKVREIMTFKQVEKVRNVSRAKNAGPWTAWWDEMAKKTVIRRLSKRLPLSTDRPEEGRLQRAIEAQDSYIEGTAEEILHQGPVQALDAPASKLDALEDAIEGELVEPEKPETLRNASKPNGNGNGNGKARYQAEASSEPIPSYLDAGLPDDPLFPQGGSEAGA